MAQKQQLKDSEYRLSKREIQKLIHAPDSFRDRCILKTLAHTGMRRFELGELDIRDIDFERHLIYIRKGKGDKSRTIPGSDDLLNDLKHHLGRRKKGPVFMSNRGQSLALRQINYIIAAAGRRAGVENPNPKYENVTPHLLRHSFARWWKDDPRRSIESLSKILGHTSVKTTLDEYGTETIDDVQENYNKAIAEMF